MTMIRWWILEGQVLDPHNEFFVSIIQNEEEENYFIPTRKASLVMSISRKHSTLNELNAWTSHFQLKQSMRPVIISEETAQHIYIAGKITFFLREICHETGPPSLTKDDCMKEMSMEMSIDMLSKNAYLWYTISNHHLLRLLFSTYALRWHICALHDVVLMTNGDFAEQIIQRLQPELDKSADHVYYHNVISHVDAAIRNSTVSDLLLLHRPTALPQSLHSINTPSSSSMPPLQEPCDRIDVKLHHKFPGDLGWDVFQWIYRLDGPLACALEARSLSGYERVSSFLWRLRHTFTRWRTSVWTFAHAMTRQLDNSNTTSNTTTAASCNRLDSLDPLQRQSLHYLCCQWLMVTRCVYLHWNAWIDYFYQEIGSAYRLLQSELLITETVIFNKGDFSNTASTLNDCCSGNKLLGNEQFGNLVMEDRTVLSSFDALIERLSRHVESLLHQCFLGESNELLGQALFRLLDMTQPMFALQERMAYFWVHLTTVSNVVENNSQWLATYVSLVDVLKEALLWNTRYMEQFTVTCNLCCKSSVELWPTEEYSRQKLALLLGIESN